MMVSEMGRARPGLAVGAVLMLLVGGMARAAIESDLVKQGVAAYNDLEYSRAIDILHKALQETLTREEKIVTFQTLAFAEVALDKPEAAIMDFENLLHIDAGFELNRTISPRVRAVFEEAKARVATGQGIDGRQGSSGGSLPTVKTTVLPKRVHEGLPLQLSAAYPGGVATRVEVFYRARGEAVFNKLDATLDTDGRFGLTIPGMHVHAPVLEYYVVLLDDAGSSVALSGTLAQPRAVDVEAERRPIYKRGWFWGVMTGVAAVGAGVATAVVLTTRSSVSASTPATISILPH
jgi:hypothetical protein